MTSIEILKKAIGMISKNGLARGTAQQDKALCLGASLVEAATFQKKFHEKEYTIARNLLCGSLGIASSYDAMARWNDDSFVTKKGEMKYKHSPQDAIKALNAAIAMTQIK